MSTAALLSAPCRYCGTTVGRAMLGALVIDAGGSCSSDPLKCWACDDGGDHDFDLKSPTPKGVRAAQEAADDNHGD
jgi:hypothetical protein